MLFWILTGLLTVLTIGTIVWWWREDWVYGAWALLWAPVVGFLVWLLLALGLTTLIAVTMGANAEERDTMPLKGMGESSEIHGQFFLLSGHIGQSETITYIQQNPDGSFEKNSHQASGSKIWEKSDAKPSMETIQYYADHPWITPTRIDMCHRHEFTVPVGSVQEGYSLTP